MTNIELILQLSEQHPEHRDQLEIIRGELDVAQAQRIRDSKTLALEREVENDLQSLIGKILANDVTPRYSKEDIPAANLLALWLLQRRIKEAGARAMAGGALGGIGSLIGALGKGKDDE